MNKTSKSKQTKYSSNIDFSLRQFYELFCSGYGCCFCHDVMTLDANINISSAFKSFILNRPFALVDHVIT